ncbi:MAG: hypothetical protein ACOX8I_00235 [Bacillota bacterium]|jgi:hypothetical protein
MNENWLVIFHAGPAAALEQCFPVARKLKDMIPDCRLAWVTDEDNADLIMETGAAAKVVDKVIVHPRRWRRRGLVAWIRALAYTGKALQRLQPSQILDYRDKRSGKEFCEMQKDHFSSKLDYWILTRIMYLDRYFSRKKGK